MHFKKLFVAKAGGYDVLEPYLDRLDQVYLIGEAADELAQWLGGRVPSRHSGDLTSAVAQARRAAEGATVLLSPACASFDQFANFEVRGEAFRELVAAEGGA